MPTLPLKFGWSFSVRSPTSKLQASPLELSYKKLAFISLYMGKESKTMAVQET